MKPNESNRGTYLYLSNGPLFTCSWVDKRTLFFLSTLHVGERTGDPTVRRKQA